MAVRFLWGNVNAEGGVETSGGGFGVRKSGTGTYAITFNSHFMASPSVVACARDPGAQKFASVTVTATSTTGCTVSITSGNAGKAQDIPFSVQIMGQ